MNTVKLNAYAKLNLTLDIKGVEGGYHLLDSLVTTVNVFDHISLKKRKDKLIRIAMHGMGSSAIPPEENNAQRAGDAFVSAFNTCGADITIHKNIPIGAGMGGSSADIAGVIAGMGMLYGITDMGAMKSLADTLGSDAGYLLTGGIARIQGRGERIEKLPFSEMHFLILLPKEGVSAKEAYMKFDELSLKGGSRTEEAVAHMIAGNALWATSGFGNDLYGAAKVLNPAVEEAYLAMRALSPSGASMTGSGSAVFGCFESRELCEWAKSRYRGKCRAIVAKSVDPLCVKRNRTPFALGEREQIQE